MKVINVKVQVFEKGDRVITPAGEGIVVSDTRADIIGDEIYKESMYDAIIQHDEGYSENTNNAPVEMEVSLPVLLDTDVNKEK